MAERKKKILVVCQHFWPESFRINDICDGLIENGYEVEVLCGIPNYPSGKFTEGYGFFKKRSQVHNGIKIKRVLEIPRGSNTSIRIFLNYISYPFFSLFHLPYLLTQKYDKIFLYQLSPVLMSLVGILLGKIKKIETTMYVLDLWPENLFSVLTVKNKLLKNIATKVSYWHYKNVDKLIAVTDKMKNVLQEVTAFPDDRMEVLPQSCEKLYEQRTYDEELANRFKDTFNIIFTGNISPAQSFETIIEAAKLLIKDNIKDVRFVIVGDGMSKEWLVQTIKNENLEKYFVFEGFKPMTDIPKYASIAHGLIACLSKSDLLDCAIPAKVISYFALGKPILLAMDGEANAFIKETKSGFVTEAENSSGLYQCIKDLYNLSEEERNQIGKRGQDFYFANFERNLNYRKLIEFLEK